MAGDSAAQLRAPEPVVPVYGAESLGAVLPGVAVALGVDVDVPAMVFPDATRACVVLIDGLGAELLQTAALDGHAPFLAKMMTTAGSNAPPVTIRVGCPTTTATSIGSFGTGLPPGQHGLLGYQVRDPERGVLLHELRWDPYTDPVRWQPNRTVFQRLLAAGTSVLNIGSEEFAGSGLTTAALRGADFVGAKDFSARVDIALSMLAQPGPRLAYLYWGAVDAAGHEHGWRSSQWQAAVREVDEQVARLAAALPPETLLVVTADHGMVDVPHSRRFDMAARPDLRRGIKLFGGESRMVQIYCRDASAHAVATVAGRLADAVGDRAWIRTRHEAIDAGWFGAVADRVRSRIGDILVAARDDFALIDSALMSKKALALVGHHGSLTEAEQLVPVLTLLA